MQAYVRTNITPPEARKFGPKSADHPSTGQPCPACWLPMEAGQSTTLVILGPGDDDEAREKARAGRFYNAAAIECHWACVSGEGESDDDA